MTTLVDSIRRARYPSSSVVSIHGVRFYCMSEYPPALDIVKRYLPFKGGPGKGVGSVSLYYLLDPTLLNDLLELTKELNIHRQLQVFQGSWIREYLLENDSVHVFRPNDGDSFCIVRQGSQVVVVVEPGPQAKRLLLRIIREIAFRLLENAGAAAIHAAMASLAGRGILIVGPSGSGKSTLLSLSQKANVVSLIRPEDQIKRKSEDTNRLSHET